MELREEEGEGEGGADKSAIGKIEGTLESKRGAAELYFVRERDATVTEGTEVGLTKANESEHVCPKCGSVISGSPVIVLKHRQACKV